LRQAHDLEIKKFNDKWEYTLFQLSETSKKIEDDLQLQHEQEMELLEEEIQAMGDPPIKFSAELLDRKFKLRQLIKIKKYTEAKVIQEEIRLKEEEELKQMEENHQKAMEKLRQNKRKKHKSEYESVKARLEKNINSKLKQRMNEYEKLLLRIQNVHNEMSSKQAREFKKIQNIHAKLLSKYSLNIDDVVSRHNQIAEESESNISEPHDYQPMNEEITYEGGGSFENYHMQGEMPNENVEEIKMTHPESQEEREVELQYVKNEQIPEFGNESGSLRAHVKSGSSGFQPGSSNDYEEENLTDEEADTVPNLRNKVKNKKSKKPKFKKKAKGKKESNTDEIGQKDLPNSFNNFYRVETKNFPSESSEESDNENN
jgi:hypothetical protein